MFYIFLSLVRESCFCQEFFCNFLINLVSCDHVADPLILSISTIGQWCKFYQVRVELLKHLVFALHPAKEIVSFENYSFCDYQFIFQDSH